MITIATGIPGSGKSLWTADTFLWLLRRNIRWHKKSGIIRKVFSNLKLSADLEKEYAGFFEYWDDPSILVKIYDADIVWDEVATHLDSTQWANLPLEIKRFMQQHRKRGIDIFGNTQDFAMIDISMRRLVSDVIILKKVFGSRDPSPTRPPVKYIWGLVISKSVDPATFEKPEKRFSGWGWFLIRKKLVQAFDTRQEIKMGVYPPLKHVDRVCVRPECDFKKTIHL